MRSGWDVPGTEQDGAGGLAAEADAVRADGSVPVISPLVRKLARDHGLDLRELTGSGPDGLITRADVEYAVRAAAHTRTAAPTAPAPDTPAEEPHAGPGTEPRMEAAPADRTEFASGARTGATSGVRGEVGLRTESGFGVRAGAGPRAESASGTRIALRGVRGAAADKLARSRREIPDATCWVDADASEFLNARAVMNSADGPKISVLALLARICTAALARCPELNSTVDAQAREIIRLDSVHLGFAAQTERGLVVPVVRDAHARDAESLNAEFGRLTQAARAGALTPAELTGSTFTLNNYGVFGVDGSTPIINHPEAAMLGVGRISAKPWVHQGELAVRQVVQLSLTFDHRVCDGGTAGGFLRYVADCVERPAVLLRNL
jgi:pyruvate dehydrogenase E2 component (dihydrolipoamide acetyltransferase)